MAVVSGKDAALTFATGYVSYATSWTIDMEIEDLDITALGDAWRRHLNGLGAGSGSYDCLVQSTSISSLGILAVSEAPASAVFTMASGDTITVAIMVTNASINASVGGGPQTVTFQFVMDGTPVLA